MPTRKLGKAEPAGRKAAYVARNRAALLLSTQRVLAEIGPEATIEQISEIAEVSVSTIYKHFENKEQLMEAAYISGFRTWELWVDEVLKEIDDPLEELIAPMRMMLRIKATHPLYAQMTARNINEVPKYFPGTEEGLVIHIQELVKKKLLVIDNQEIRIRMVSACLLTGLAEQIFNPAAKFEDADNAVEVILGILGVSPAKAKKLAHGALPDFQKFLTT
jgi:AcrR family transcriptional regulator